MQAAACRSPSPLQAQGHAKLGRAQEHPESRFNIGGGMARCHGQAGGLLGARRAGSTRKLTTSAGGKAGVELPDDRPMVHPARASRAG